MRFRPSVFLGALIVALVGAWLTSQASIRPNHPVQETVVLADITIPAISDTQGRITGPLTDCRHQGGAARAGYTDIAMSFDSEAIGATSPGLTVGQTRAGYVAAVDTGFPSRQSHYLVTTSSSMSANWPAVETRYPLKKPKGGGVVLAATVEEQGGSRVLNGPVQLRA